MVKIPRYVALQHFLDPWWIFPQLGPMRQPQLYWIVRYCLRFGPTLPKLPYRRGLLDRLGTLVVETMGSSRLINGARRAWSI